MSFQNWQFLTPSPLLIVFLLSKIGNFWPPPLPPWDDIVYGRPLILYCTNSGSTHRDLCKMTLSIGWTLYTLCISRYLYVSMHWAAINISDKKQITESFMVNDSILFAITHRGWALHFMQIPCRSVRIFRNPTIFNIIRWLTGSMGLIHQASDVPSIISFS